MLHASNAVRKYTHHRCIADKRRTRKTQSARVCMTRKHVKKLDI